MIKLQHRPAQSAQEAVTAPPAAQPNRNTAPAQNASQSPTRPFSAQDGQSYRAAYRAAFDFHARHNPPTLEADYWDNTADDLETVSRDYADNHFLQELLTAAYTELQREYMQLKK